MATLKTKTQSISKPKTRSKPKARSKPKVNSKRKTSTKSSQIIASTITPENKCSFCKGSKCCQYVTESLVTPRSVYDFDLLLWQISHPNIHIYKDDEGWYLVFLSQCQHLLSSGRCGIYEKRPMICREHSNDYCEFDTTIEGDSELYFHNYQELDTYCRKRFKSWDKRFDKLSA